MNGLVGQVRQAVHPVGRAHAWRCAMFARCTARGRWQLGDTAQLWLGDSTPVRLRVVAVFASQRDPGRVPAAPPARRTRRDPGVTTLPPRCRPRRDGWGPTWKQVLRPQAQQHVSQLARELEMSRPLVHMHLRRLEEVGLVVGRMEVSADRKAMRFFDVAPFAYQLISEVIRDAVRTMEDR